MKSLILLLAVGLIAGISAQAAPMDDRLAEAAEVLRKIENEIPPELLGAAQGLAIVEVTSGGIGVAGFSGDGIVLKKLDGGWSAPVAFTTGGGSIGLQLGVETVGYVYVLNNQTAIDQFTSTDEVEFDAEAVAVAGPKNKRFEKMPLEKPSIFAYTTTDGAFAGASVGGSFIEVEEDVNMAVYGAEATTGRILASKASMAPDAAEPIYEVLAKKMGTAAKTEKNVTVSAPSASGEAHSGTMMKQSITVEDKQDDDGDLTND